MLTAFMLEFAMRRHAVAFCSVRLIIAIIHVSMQCHSICSAMHSPLPETFLFFRSQGFMAIYHGAAAVG